MNRMGFCTCLSLVTVSLLVTVGCIATETGPEITFSGQIQYFDLEGGFYGIVTDEGEHYLPLNLADEFKQDGLTVLGTGIVDTDVMTIQMWGQPFQIITISKTGESDTGETLGLTLTAEKERDMLSLLLHSSGEIQKAFDTIDTGLTSAAVSLKGKNLASYDLSPILASCVDIHPAVYESTVKDRSSVIIAAYPDEFSSSVGVDVSSQSLATRTLKNPVPGMGNYFLTIEDRYAVIAEYPLFSSANSITGYINVLFDPKALVDTSIQSVDAGSMQVLVAETDGTILYHADTGLIGSSMQNMTDSWPVIKDAQSGAISLGMNSEGAGKEEMAVFWTTVSLYGTSWKVLVI